MSTGHIWRRECAAQKLAPLLRAACDDWAFARDAPPLPAWRCTSCGKDTHAASTSDPTRCIRCAPPVVRPNPYAWRAAPFGRIRKVSPFVAALWECEPPKR